MSATKSFGLPWTTVNSCSTAPVFIPATQWMDPSNMEKGKATFEVRGRCGNMTLLPAYQTADIPTSPNGAVELRPNGTFEDSEGVQFPSGWKPLDAGVQTKQSIRFGWLVKNSSGTALSSARVGGQIQIVTC
jgi:hypothetical protein